MKIYIAAPYTASSEKEIEANVNRVIDVGISILKMGHIPFIPHLTHFVELRSKETSAGLKYEDYMEWDREWLLACDAILYLASSPGADRELKLAKKNGLTEYCSVEEIPERSLEELPGWAHQK